MLEPKCGEGHSTYQYIPIFTQIDIFILHPAALNKPHSNLQKPDSRTLPHTCHLTLPTRKESFVPNKGYPKEARNT